MARFKFRMTTLLRLRESARDERRALLAQAYAAQQKLVEQRAELQALVDEARSEHQRGGQPGRLDVDRLIEAYRYQGQITIEIQAVERQMVAIDAEVEKRRQALVHADSEVRVLEKLRESQLERHRQVEAVIEGKQLDEIAGRSAAREEVRQWAD
jgi:flagellar export protein FliJ